jgi:curved DNA-binding protein CbpA
MQDVNEAWRVLRDPGQRAAYDRVLETPPPEPVVVHREDDLDRVYERPLAQPGDLSVLIVRAVPWIAVLLVLGIIFVFTAIAGRDDGPRDLVGKCVITEDAEPVETPCDRQNDGRLVDVVSDSKECAVGTTAKIVSDGDWLCLEPAP